MLLGKAGTKWEGTIVRGPGRLHEWWHFHSRHWGLTTAEELAICDSWISVPKIKKDNANVLRSKKMSSMATGTWAKEKHSTRALQEMGVGWEHDIGQWEFIGGFQVREWTDLTWPVFLKIFGKMIWWLITVITALRRVDAGGSRVQGNHWLHGEL